MISLQKKMKKFAQERSNLFFMILIGISAIFYVGIIIFGFIPTTSIIETSGYSTSDLQNGSSIQEVEEILSAWEPVMKYLIQLSILDYLFIIAGLILMLSLNLLLIRVLIHKPKYLWIPITGMFFTVLSRTTDACENLWTILIYTNPEGISFFLITLLNWTSLIKCIIDTFEYGFLIYGWSFYFYLKIF